MQLDWARMYRLKSITNQLNTLWRLGKHLFTRFIMLIIYFNVFLLFHWLIDKNLTIEKNHIFHCWYFHNWKLRFTYLNHQFIKQIYASDVNFNILLPRACYPLSPTFVVVLALFTIYLDWDRKWVCQKIKVGINQRVWNA